LRIKEEETRLNLHEYDEDNEDDDDDDDDDYCYYDDEKLGTIVLKHIGKHFR